MTTTTTTTTIFTQFISMTILRISHRQTQCFLDFLMAHFSHHYLSTIQRHHLLYLELCHCLFPHPNLLFLQAKIQKNNNNNKIVNMIIFSQKIIRTFQELLLFFQKRNWYNRSKFLSRQFVNSSHAYSKLPC